MSMIPACRLLPYLELLGPLPSSSHPCEVKDVVAAAYRIQHPPAEDGKPGDPWIANATAAQVSILAKAEQIFGTATRLDPHTGMASKLKYLTLMVSPEEAQATLDAAGIEGHRKHFTQYAPVAEANFTVEHVNEPTGQYYKHRNEVCAGYPQAAFTGRAE